MTAEQSIGATRDPSRITFTLGLRRVHMYLGLFLVPWMCMYALSTIVMNHRERVQSFYSTKNPATLPERELQFLRSFPTNTSRDEIGMAILQDLGFEGAYRVSGGRDGKPLIIDRQRALQPRRITWDSSSGKLTIEKQEFRMLTFLERMHRRRGYQHPFALDDIWAFSVDVATVAMVLWSLSGLWLWWSLPSTRFWGAVCGASGLIIFVLFLFLL